MTAGLEARDVAMRFPGDAGQLFAIDELDLAPGQSLGIRGPSGAGKTTLFNCLAGIERPTAGRILWNGQDICALGETERDRWRRTALGLVFQDFHLIDGLDALDNVLLPASFNRWQPEPALRHRAAALLEQVGVVAPSRRAGLLSRGERQRVAIARALLFNPPAVLADEPTASLDPDHRDDIAALLTDAVRQAGAGLIVLSHDLDLLARMDRCLELRHGTLMEL